jgi:hypothetical protein|nr:MAG TPA: Protein of unknown function (DUF1642) [Caudoviricetes sp.]
MNKQDALKQIEEQRDMILELHGWDVFGYIKGIINQLDEPQKIELPKVDFKKSQKVKVPQFVDDVIEGAREHSPELEDALHYACSNGSQEFTEWYQKKSNRDLFARAWLDGYEVEAEKRYYVRFKWIEDSYSYLTLIKHLHAWTLKDITLDKKFRTAHTRKELEEAGFGWVFDCPGIEIEEVE